MRLARRSPLKIESCVEYDNKIMELATILSNAMIVLMAVLSRTFILSGR